MGDLEKDRRDVLKKVGMAGGASLTGLSTTAGNVTAKQSKPVVDRAANPQTVSQAFEEHGEEALELLRERHEEAARRVETKLEALSSVGSIDDVDGVETFVYTLGVEEAERLGREERRGAFLRATVATEDLQASLDVYPIQERGEIALTRSSDLTEEEARQTGTESTGDQTEYLVPEIEANRETNSGEGQQVEAQAERPRNCEKVGETCEDTMDTDCPGGCQQGSISSQLGG